MANRRCPKLTDCQDLGPAPVLTGYAAEALKPLPLSATGPLEQSKAKTKKKGEYGPGAIIFFTEHLRHSAVFLFFNLAHSERPFLSALGAGNTAVSDTPLVFPDPASPVDGAQNPQTCQVCNPVLQQMGKLRARVNRCVLGWHQVRGRTNL